MSGSPESVRMPRLLITFMAVFAAGAVGLMLPSAGARPTLPLLTSGIAVAACVRWGPSMWPAVFAAAITIDLWIHQTLFASLAVGVGVAGGAMLTAWLLERRGFDGGFGRARDVPLFIFSAALGTMLVPTLGLIGFRVAGDPAAMSDPLRWVRWWSNTTAGVLLIGPMLVAVNRRSL